MKKPRTKRVSRKEMNRVVDGFINLIAMNIKKYRLQKGMSIRELSRRSGVSAMTISEIERTPRGLRLDTMKGLSLALGIHMRKLTSNREKKKGR